MPRPEETESRLRRAYHEMFRRHRDHLLEQRRQPGQAWVSESEIDRVAWREADDDMRRMLAMRSRNEDRKKRKRGEAA
jgi:hypothetical protein